MNNGLQIPALVSGLDTREQQDWDEIAYDMKLTEPLRR
jgi:hypothetical protein